MKTNNVTSEELAHNASLAESPRVNLDSLPELASFNDMRRANVVKNRVTLARWIANQGFPPGFLIGPNSRRWDKASIIEFVNSRPRFRTPTAPQRAA